MDYETNLELISSINNSIKGYEFFQVVRILENVLNEGKPIGTHHHPKFDFIKFRQNPTLNYHTSDVSRLRIDTKNERIEVVTNFIGLLGTNGIMPYFFTELIQEQLRKKNISMLNFLNIFYSRMISFLYRAKAINSQLMSYERTGFDFFSNYLNSLIGHNTFSVRKHSCLNKNFKLYFAGHFYASTAGVESIVSIVKEYFDIDIKIQEFVTDWIELPAGAKFELGVSPDNCTNGVNVFLGDKVSNLTSKFKIILGPMDLDTYNSFLPGKPAFIELEEVISLCVPRDLKYDLVYVLKGESVPLMDGKSPMLLGYNTWNISSSIDEDQSDFNIKNFEEYKHQ